MHHFFHTPLCTSALSPVLVLWNVPAGTPGPEAQGQPPAPSRPSPSPPAGTELSCCGKASARRRRLYAWGQGQGRRPRFVYDKVPFGAVPILGWSLLAASLRLVPRLWLGRELGLPSQL